MVVDLSESSFAFDRPIALTSCTDSSIGCSLIVAEPIHQDVETSISPINETHETWTAQVTITTEFSGSYRNVPVAIEVPKTAQLNAGGNTPYAIKTEGDRRYIMLRIPELESERTLKITVLKEVDAKRTLWERISSVLGSF